MTSHLSRRDFLKLASHLPLLTLQPSPPDAPTSSSTHPNPHNILILVFDTLSAQHLALFGYHRHTSPNLVRFADRATVFHHHYATANFTSPATASLFTGTYPWSHRAFNYWGTPSDPYPQQNLFSLLPPDTCHHFAYTHNPRVMDLLHQVRPAIEGLLPIYDLSISNSLLSEKLFNRDYSLAIRSESLIHGLDGHKPSSLLKRILNLLPIIHNLRTIPKDHQDNFPRGLPTNSFSNHFLLETVVDWLKDTLSHMPQPYLGYIHVHPPHEPYTTRRDFINRFNDAWIQPPKPDHFFSQGLSNENLNHQCRLYDEYIAYADAEFGRLLDALDADGSLANTCLVVTSDHGQLFERGIHGHVNQTLYEPLIHVPLLISLPGQSQRQDIHTPTSCIDLLPTLLLLAGQPIPSWVEGQVLPPFTTEPPDLDRAIFSLEAKNNPKHQPLKTATAAIIQWPYKLIHYRGYPGYHDQDELYNLESDPAELNNRFSQETGIGAALKDQLIERVFTP